MAEAAGADSGPRPRWNFRPRSWVGPGETGRNGRDTTGAGRGRHPRCGGEHWLDGPAAARLFGLVGQAHPAGRRGGAGDKPIRGGARGFSEDPAVRGAVGTAIWRPRLAAPDARCRRFYRLGGIAAAGSIGWMEPPRPAYSAWSDKPIRRGGEGSRGQAHPGGSPGDSRRIRQPGGRWFRFTHAPPQGVLSRPII